MIATIITLSHLLSLVHIIADNADTAIKTLAAVAIHMHGRGQSQHGGGTTSFAPLHLYFVDAATGNDSNTGLDTSHAWLTPHQSVECGDVRLSKGSTKGTPVIYGQYSNFGASTGPGVVSGCPSNSGGIDGVGGIYFATMLCVGDVGSCKIDIGTPSIGDNHAIAINNSNWAVEGFGLTSGYSLSGSGFAGVVDTSSALVHHIAFINSVAWHNASAFTVEGGGSNAGYGNGADYWAMVGNLVQDSAGRCDGFWTAAIAIIGTINLDTNAGTHVLVDSNFVLNSQQVGCSVFGVTNATTPAGNAVLHFAATPAGVLNGMVVFDNTSPTVIPGGTTVLSSTGTTVTMSANAAGAGVGNADAIQFSASVSDGEAIMDDSIDCKGNFASLVVHRNNITVVSERFGLHHFFNGNTATVTKDYNNTIFASSKGAFSNDGAGGSYGELNFQLGNVTSATFFAYNNILKTNAALRPDGGVPYALLNGSVGTASNFKIGNVAGNPAASENIAKGLASVCNGTCNSGNDVVEFNSQSFGTNIYTDPLFNNATDAINNRIGTPNCAGFTNTAACMGWNHGSRTATNPSLIYDMAATATGTAGKGYQTPSNCVLSDPDFPIWLKGVVYLQASGWVNGATITMNDGLVTKPCGY